MRSLCVYVLLLSAALVPCSLVAQQPATAPNAPLELPDFLVTGKAIMDIAGGAKQSPQKPAKMARAELDSLNPTEKFPTPLVPNRPLPMFGRSHKVSSSYADMSFGSYVSPSITAGHSMALDNYLIDVEGGASHSQQWQPGAFRTDVGATLSSSYLAPDKFLFFGKGLTETDLSVRNSNYSLYADTTAPVRSLLRASAGLTTEAFISEIPFVAGVSWNTSRVNDLSGLSRVDSRLHGDVRCDLGSQRTSNLSFSIDAQSLDSVSYPFIQAGGSTSLGDSVARITVGGGLQYAKTSAGDSRLGVELRANGLYFASASTTLSASARSGLRRSSFSDMLAVNPYLSATALVDVPYDIFDLRGAWKYHPTMRFQTVLGIGMRRTEREGIWQNTDQRTFAPAYCATTSIDLSAELLYRLSERDQLAGGFRLRNVSLDSNRKATYVEPLKLDLLYRRLWSDALTTSASIQYVGKRRISMYTNEELDAYLNVAIALDYGLGSGLHLTLKADNLINSSIILWNGYRERGIFVSGGITWRM